MLGDGGEPTRVAAVAAAEDEDDGEDTGGEPARKHVGPLASVVTAMDHEAHQRSGLRKRDRALEPLPHEVPDADERALCKRLAAFTPAEQPEVGAEEELEGFDSELAFLLGTGVGLEDEDHNREAHHRRAMPYMC